MQFISARRSAFDVPRHATVLGNMAHKCLSLQFLVDFYDEVVKPLDPNMTTKRVADELLKPYTRARGGGSVMDAVASDINMERLDAFVSHADNNEFFRLVNSLREYYDKVEWEKIYIYIDTFCTDLNNAVMNTPSVLDYKETLFVFNGKVHKFSQLIERLDEVRFYSFDRIP